MSDIHVHTDKSSKFFFSIIEPKQLIQRKKSKTGRKNMKQTAAL